MSVLFEFALPYLWLIPLVLLVIIVIGIGAIVMSPPGEDQ